MEFNQLLLQTSNIVFVGMFAVFIFLSILVLAVLTLVKINAWIENNNKQPERGEANRVPNQSDIPDEVVAAISAAIVQYRKNK